MKPREEPELSWNRICSWAAAGVCRLEATASEGEQAEGDVTGKTILDCCRLPDASVDTVMRIAILITSL